MNIVDKICHVWSHGLMMATLLRFLAHLDLKIVPYHLYLESNDVLSQTDLSPFLDQHYETITFNPEDIISLKGFDHTEMLEKEFSALWNTGFFQFIIDNS
jgi:hypothetical protein